MNNPLTSFLHDHNPSHAEFAKEAGITEQVVYKTSHGVFTQLPPAIALYMTKNTPDKKAGEFQQEYLRWRDRQLRDLKHSIEAGTKRAEGLYVRPEFLAEEYPTFEKWRASLNPSQMGFCLEYFIPQSASQRYEAGKATTLPSTLKERLLFLGKDYSFISALNKLPLK